MELYSSMYVNIDSIGVFISFKLGTVLAVWKFPTATHWNSKQNITFQKKIDWL